MRRYAAALALALALALACCSLQTLAQPVAQDGWVLQDQFEASYRLDTSTRVLMIARSYGSARLVNSALEHTPPGYLDARNVVFIADIARVPGLIQRVLVPNMRSASYRILLDRDGLVAEGYGGDRDSVQWLELDEGKVVSERRFSDLASLRQALAGLVAH